MSTSGRRRRDTKQKTLQIPSDDATHVGEAPSGWENETTTTGSMPTGWDAESTISGPAPAGWDPDAYEPPAVRESEEEIEVPGEAERTVEQPSSQSGARPAPHEPTPSRPRPPPPERSAESTAAGPPADFQLSPKKRRSTRPPPAAGGGRPTIEVEVRRVSNVATRGRRVPTIYEIWTKNRVYALDAELKCIEVIDLSTGQSDSRHPFLGASVVGGQRKVKDANELTFPLPTPDAEAVFQVVTPNGRTQLMVTSKVTRVILHVQVVKLSPKQSEAAWDTITSSRNP